MIGSKVSAIYKASLSSLTTWVLNPEVKSLIIEPVLTVLTTSHCVSTSCGQTGKIGQPAFLNLTNVNIHQKALQNINWVCCLLTGINWLQSTLYFWPHFIHQFGIMRIKSRHHDLMMPPFGSNDAKIMPKKTLRKQASWETRDTKA